MDIVRPRSRFYVEFDGANLKLALRDHHVAMEEEARNRSIAAKDQLREGRKLMRNSDRTDEGLPREEPSRREGEIFAGSE